MDQKKIDFLDGFRGTLAIWVLMNNSRNKKIFFRYRCLYRSVLYFYSQRIFIILLTKCLLNQFNNHKNNYKDNILIIVKYFVRRFFRIYIPFVILATLIKSIPSIRFVGIYHSSYFGTFFDLITLKPTKSHLWTIIGIF